MPFINISSVKGNYAFSKVAPSKAKSLKSKKHRRYKVKIKKDVERRFN